jgi:peptide/nickel transport system permease protein
VRTALAWLLLIGLAAAGAVVLASLRGRLRDARGPWAMAASRFLSRPTAIAALLTVLVLYGIALLAPWLSPYDPIAQLGSPGTLDLPPSSTHLFGTDGVSRDVLSRVLYGARVSLSIGLLAALLSATIGTAYGAIAGFFGGRVDTVMMRAIDAALAIPRVVVVLAVLTLWNGVSVPALIVLIGATGWFGVSRLVRAEVVSISQREMVVAARALGVSRTRTLWRHVLPHALAPVIVAVSLGVGHVILLEAGLSYLGVGVQPPTPSWGSIMNDGSESVSQLWWLTLFPGLTLVLTTLAFNTLGDRLRDALDARQVEGT